MHTESTEQAQAGHFSQRRVRQASKPPTELEQCHETDMDGLDDVHEDLSGAVCFIVPPHFSIVKGFTEGQTALQVSPATGPQARAGRPPALAAAALATSREARGTNNHETMGLCKCGLSELHSVLARYKICRLCEPHSEISDDCLSWIEPEMVAREAIYSGSSEKTTPMQASKRQGRP